jgi:hypothetical protein
MYGLNEANFENMLVAHRAALKPETLSEELEPFRQMKRDDVINALPEADALIVLDVQWADSLKARVVAERVEKEKVEKIYAALQAQLV